MNKQVFSDKYEEDREVLNLIDRVDEKYKDLQGTIFYKFPTIKGMEGKFDDVLSQKNFIPESFFYQFNGYPENVFLYSKYLEEVDNI